MSFGVYLNTNRFGAAIGVTDRVVKFINHLKKINNSDLAEVDKNNKKITE